MAEEKDWKNQYKTVVLELEDKESAWKSTEALLRKTINRVSIAGRGIDPALDDQLRQIHELCRDKADARLEPALDELSRTVSSLDDKPATATAQAAKKSNADAPTLLFSLLHGIEFQEEQRGEFTSICDTLQQLLTEGGQEADITHQIHLLADLINQNMKHSAMVGRDTVVDQNSTVSVHEVLITLLEKLTVIQAGTHSANLLRTEVLDHIDEDEWPQTVDKIVGCISEALTSVNREKSGIEEFIIEISRELSKISEVITSDRESNQTEMEDRQSLQDLIQHSVKSIETSFDNTSEIGQLQHIVANTVRQIHSGVEDFVARSKQRQATVNERNEHLMAQIATMTKKTQTLNRQLRENRKKLLFDTLTGAGSRLSYEESMAQEMSRWSRYGTSFSYAILDIDYFKKINDNYGHNTGDKALRLIAGKLMNEVRKADKLFRIGGEEFVLLMPGTSVDMAAALVKKLRDIVAGSPIHFNQKRLSITLSAGITEPVEHDTIESLSERADQALYKAKHSGRNCQFIA